MNRILLISGILFLLFACSKQDDTNISISISTNKELERIEPLLIKIKEIEYSSISQLREETNKLLAGHINDEQVQLVGNYYLAKADFLENKIPETAARLEEVYQKLKEHSHYKLMAEIDIFLVFYHYANTEYEDASKRVKNSFEYCFESKLDLERNTILLGMSPVVTMTTPELRKEDILLYLKGFDEDDWSIYLSKIHHSLAAAYIYLKEFDKALEILNKSIEKNKKHGFTSELIMDYQKMGVAYRESKEDYKAIKALKKSIAEAEKFGALGQAIYYRSIGHLYSRMKDFDLAVEAYKSAVQAGKQARDTSSIASGYAYLGWAHYKADKINNFDKANKYYDKAFKFSEKSPLSRKLTIERKKWTLQQNPGNEKEVKKLKEELTRLRKSLEIQFTNSSLDEFKVNSMLTLKSRNEQVKLLVSQNKLQKEKILRQQYIKILTILIALFFIGLLYNYYRKIETLKIVKQKKEELITAYDQLSERNNIIIEQNTELTKRKMELASELKSKLTLLSNQFNTNQELKKILTLNESITVSDRKKIIRLLGNSGNKQIIAEMDFQFLEMNKDFFTTITTLHPKLTSNNLKLCAYLKMNLSTKEIASLMFVSPEAVKVARSRLRKKLGLKDSGFTLPGYMNSILQSEANTAQSV